MSAIVHDHFDGSAHCVECEGECKLDGAELLLTQLIRYLFEQRAYVFKSGGEAGDQFWQPYLTMEVIKESGVDVPRFWERAKKAVLS